MDLKDIPLAEYDLARDLESWKALAKAKLREYAKSVRGNAFTLSIKDYEIADRVRGEMFPDPNEIKILVTLPE